MFLVVPSVRARDFSSVQAIVHWTWKQIMLILERCVLEDLSSRSVEVDYIGRSHRRQYMYIYIVYKYLLEYKVDPCQFHGTVKL